MDEIERDFESESIDLSDLPEEEVEELVNGNTLTPISLASGIMTNLRPGFVIIGSPFMEMTERGFLYPTSIGVSVNDELGITKTVLASILREVVASLEQDINKVMAFVQEATKND